MASSRTAEITQGSVAEYKVVFADSAHVLMSTVSGTAIRAHRRWDRPALVSIVLVWCVDRFTRHALQTLRSRSPCASWAPPLFGGFVRDVPLAFPHRTFCP